MENLYLFKCKTAISTCENKIISLFKNIGIVTTSFHHIFNYA